MTDIKYAVFVSSHGRAKTSTTVDTLLNNGYKGDWFVVVDDLDSQLSAYRERFGKSNVIVFDKKRYASKVDYMNNSGVLAGVIFSRYAGTDVAREKGYKKAILVDDDLTSVKFRYENEEGQLLSKDVTNFQRLFDEMVEFSEVSNAHSLGLGMQGGFIGGAKNSDYIKGYSRRCHGLFLVDTDKTVHFKGIAEEDSNALLIGGSTGQLFMSLRKMQMTFPEERQEGGMSDFYKESNYQYNQRFYPLMAMPSCNKLRVGKENIEVRTKWKNALVEIVSEEYKK